MKVRELEAALKYLEPENQLEIYIEIIEGYTKKEFFLSDYQIFVDENKNPYIVLSMWKSGLEKKVGKLLAVA